MTTSLFVTRTSAGVTLFEDYITGPWTYSYAAAAGTAGVLDLLLSSEVAAGLATDGAAGASGFGMTNFAVSAVPLPASWMLLLCGLGPVVVAVRRSASKGARSAA